MQITKNFNIMKINRTSAISVLKSFITLKKYKLESNRNCSLNNFKREK